MLSLRELSPVHFMFKRTLTTALLAAATLTANANWNPQLGAFSRHPTDIWSRVAGSDKPLIIKAPDHQSTVRAIYSETTDSDVKLEVSGRIGSGTVDLGPGVASELLWKPDGSAFLVTTSDEGANGSYRTIFIFHDTNGLSTWDLTGLISKAFGQPVRCDVPEAPNVGGVGFTPSGNLLIAAQIVDHSVCDSAGTFVIYEVNPDTRQVVKRFGQLEAKRAFHNQLGQFLLYADDECLRHPKSCYVSTNHPESRHTH
jgi:hypothetical protein